MRRLLMISTDRKIFEEGSAVRARQIEYAKGWDEVHIIVFNKNPIRRLADETAIAPNCFVYSTRSRFKLMYPFDAIRLGRFIIERRGITDITCQDSSMTAMAGLALKKQALRLGRTIPLEVQIHEDIGSPYYGFKLSNKLRKSMALKYIPQADAIRVVSDRIKRFLVDDLGVDAARVTVRPIAVDAEKIRTAPIITAADLHKKYPRFEKIALMASRLEPEKNIGLAINAWSEVLKDLPRAGLVIVGEGSERASLEALISRLGIAQSAVVEKWADMPALASYYKTADLFLNTSLFEGYGMTLVEAAAAGCKAVSTDVGVARETGATVVGHDAGEVARAIITALT